MATGDSGYQIIATARDVAFEAVRAAVADMGRDSACAIHCFAALGSLEEALAAYSAP